jgi:glutathione S-transferase
MYRLYIGNKNYSSWSLRPWILMRELAIPFEERVMPFEDATSWSSFRRFSPTGRVPCLHDGDTVVWDSLAIAEYLADRHAGVWPADPQARAWARCAAAEMHSGFAVLRAKCGMNCGLRIRLDSMPPELRRDIERIGELWTEGLDRFGGPFLAGPAFTAVDAFFAPVVFRVQTYGLDLPPRAASYAQLMLQQPGLRAWQADALAEPWRDAAHEAEVLASGQVLADLRSPAPAVRSLATEAAR